MAALSDNVGMGMMGADASFAKSAMMGDEKSKAALRMMLGGGLDSLADMFSGKSPEGSVPSPTSSPAPSSSSVGVMPPVDNSVNSVPTQAPAQPQVAGAVMPIQQLNAPTTDQTQPTVGNYRKFLRFQDFGSTPQ